MAKSNPFRFSTKYQDDETDLVYYGYRYYNASTGRWLSRDPIGELGFGAYKENRQLYLESSAFSAEVANLFLAEPGGLNLYSFVRNEPISLVDFLGQVPCNTKALAACMTTCVTWARQHYIKVKCTMNRNPWTLGLCWKVDCRCVTKCYLAEGIPIANKLICKYNCPMRHTSPGDYAMLVVPAVEGCPKSTTDGGDPIP